MIKHIITTECNNKCRYCITKNLKVKTSDNLIKMVRLYLKLSISDDEIMITGGEPTLNKDFKFILNTARNFFNKVYITTINELLLSAYSGVDAITFSLHKMKYGLIRVHVDVPVYAAILAFQYKKWLPYVLKDLGYSGLTINEDQRGKEIFDEKVLPPIKDFSYKINRRGYCMKNTFILPDLSIRKTFNKYL